MATISCRVRYRPLRVGWVTDGTELDLNLVLSHSHALWGGLFNPILVEQSPAADEIARLFNIDVLASSSGSNYAGQRIAAKAFLPWPAFGRSLFEPASRTCNVLDVRHAVFDIEDLLRRKLIPADFALHDITWANDDPLRLVFAATFGHLPDSLPYREFVSGRLTVQPLSLEPNHEVPPLALRSSLPHLLSGHQVRVHRRRSVGIFVGDASSVADIVEFWNLRASGAVVEFFDPVFRPRLEPFLREFVSENDNRRRPGMDARLSLWSTRPLTSERWPFSDEETRSRFVYDSWRDIVAADVSWGSHFTQASVSYEDEVPKAALPLGNKPFRDESWCHDQLFVTSLKFVNFRRNERFSFWPPHVRSLNEFYGREVFYRFDRARSEPESIAIICEAGDSHLSINGLDNDVIIEKVFDACGIKCAASHAGRIARRLIRQMGRLQECRVFKIRGVRQLIRQHSNGETFTRSAAVQTIGNIVGGVLNFTEYERLFLEPRHVAKLTPEAAFNYLLKKEVFRVGLELLCPSCELPEWKPIGGVDAITMCGLCGNEYSVVTQLKDRDWRFKASGLFHRLEREKGPIPVAVLLQQLDTTLKDQALSAFAACTDVNWESHKCETDFVWLFNRPAGSPVVAIGECKDHTEIDSDDVANMGALAKKLRLGGLDAFVVMAKLSAFTEGEISLCRRLHMEAEGRVVLLTDAELEPYEVWQKVDPRSVYSHALERLARMTAERYFDRPGSTGPEQIR